MIRSKFVRAQVVAAFVMLTFAALTFAESPTRYVRARVDPRVELMSIIFRLSGANEYNQPASKSPYSDEVETRFGGFRDHPVVEMAQRLRSDHGISYDAVMSMAVHVEDARSLKEKIPLAKSPPRLDSRWPLEEGREFLVQARGFVKETRFHDFAEAYQELYEAAGARMTHKLAERAFLQWFDSFFGVRPGARFYVIVSLLNGPCNYGTNIRYPDGREEICPVLGVAKFDEEGIPVIGDDVFPTVVHEVCHSYANPIVDKYAGDLEAAGKRIYSGCEQTMRKQAYSKWKTMIYESMVRVSVVRYLAATEGKEAAQKEVQRQHDRGFKWIGDLSRLVEEYESHRARYENFATFMPEVVEFFDEYEGEQEVRIAEAPQVIAMTPKNGATDVDPQLKEIRITFDRSMDNGNWSVVCEKKLCPKSAGKVHFDEECKEFTMPVRLEPDRSYRFWLNSSEFDAFRSKEGVPLEPVEVTFRTKHRER